MNDEATSVLHLFRETFYCLVKVPLGGKFGGEWIHVYVQLSPLPVYLKLSQHC